MTAFKDIPSSNLAPPLAGSPETDVLVEPSYPILDKNEVWDGFTDLRDQLSAEEQTQLRTDEAVIHIYRRELAMPKQPVTPLEILMKAANAAVPEEIGFMGPTVAS